MKRLATRMRALWRVLWRSDRLETEMQEEMRFHLEMEADRLMREQRLDPQEARRQALIRFGGLEKYKEEGRDARGRQWIDAIALDARFGVRMLVKHRGLSLIGGFAMAVTIAIGATFFEVMTEVINPALPLEDGGRVVALQNATANDFVTWRDRLKSVQQLGAFRTAQHSLVTANALPDTVRVAEMTASGFTLARTPPLLGRYLLESDEGAGAAPVLVIGYQVWRSRFASDPGIVGRAITLGGIPSTVIGVMPAGFKFPIDHQFWIPLRTDTPGERPMDGTIHMFGRLASGLAIEAAQVELTTVAERAAANAGTQERRHPVVVPYTRAHAGVAGPGDLLLLSIAQLLIGSLTFVVAANLAILVYARTITRLGEIAVRTALGANRGRILAQLFIEALALTLVGAAIGLVLAAIALGQLQSFVPAILPGGVPFWIELELSLATVWYALLLAALAALITGVLPGLKATSRRLNANLHEWNQRSGTRLGSMWTTLVVAQIAVAVAVLPAAVYMAWQVAQLEISGPGFAAEKIVIARAALSGGTSTADPGRIAARQLELVSRLQAEPGLAAVSFSSSVPGLTAGRRIQFDDPSIPLSARAQESQDAGSLAVGTIHVAVDMFDVYEATILAGRAFTAGDLGGANSAIVNRTFVETLLPDRNPLGVRFRLEEHAQPGTQSVQESYQIVGVVRDFPSFPPALALDDVAVVYLPVAPGKMQSLMLSMRLNGSMPADFIDRIRTIGAEVDPQLELHARPLITFYNEMRSLWRYVAWGLGLLTTSVLLLSAAGIYALLSFTIARRTREIGIRVALGAHPRPLLFSIFGRVLRQLSLGALVGSVLSAAVFTSADFGLPLAALLLIAVAVIMWVVGLIAALGPARRTLRMPATEALRADA